MIDFLIIVFLIGIIIASIQDLKRREVDNWINFFLLACSIFWVLINSIWQMSLAYFLFGILCFVLLFILGNIFYYGRVFAGGDAKLLIAMFGLFVSISLTGMLVNIGLFIILMMLAGSVYGLGYSFYLMLGHWSNFKKDFSKRAKNWYILITSVLGLILFVLSSVNFMFFVIGILVFFGPLLFIFGKSIEKTSMIKEISGKELREGDWLVSSTTLGKKVIQPDWEGLTKKQVQLLKTIKKVKIKDGIPFVPAFLIAFIAWIFREQLIFWFFNLI